MQKVGFLMMDTIHCRRSPVDVEGMRLRLLRGGLKESRFLRWVIADSVNRPQEAVTTRRELENGLKRASSLARALRQRD